MFPLSNKLYFKTMVRWTGKKEKFTLKNSWSEKLTVTAKRWLDGDLNESSLDIYGCSLPYLFKEKWCLNTPDWKKCRVKSINHWRCNPMVLWEVWILASILSPMHNIITRYALIYSLNYVGKKMFWISRNETQ